MIYTKENRAWLVAYLEDHDLSSGLGDEESACSLAAINLAISGELKDFIPSCMSLALGKATIILQDAMPDEMRNSERYTTLLPDMPGTGRDREKERADIILNWMWETALPQLQDIADNGGFGTEWRAMCEQRNYRAADQAARAAPLTGTGQAACSARSASAPRCGTDVIAASAARVADVASQSTEDFLTKVDPIGVLERMTYLDAVPA